MIDLLNITPHEVSRDLKGYTVMLYGQPKTGKTTIASKFPKALLLAFETGYLALPGVMAQPINRWSEFKQVLKQLEKPEVREKFENIILDTVDIAYSLCEKYICSQQGVSSIGEIPYGQGWALASKEFDEAIRFIPQHNYGLVMISHAQDKTFKDESGQEYNQICPTLSNRPRNIVDRAADLIIYANPVQKEDGTTRTIGYMRGTPRFVAGSRFKYTPEKIEFSYDSLVNAISEAIDKQAQELEGKFVTDAPSTGRNAPEGLDFDALMTEFNDLTAKIRKATGEEFKTKWAGIIRDITTEYLGAGKKVSNMSPAQAEQLQLIVDELKDKVAQGL